MADEPTQPKPEEKPKEGEQPPKGKVKKEKKPKPPGGKKRSKLPLLAVLVLVVGSGGFFAMKTMGHKKEPPKAPKVGSTVELDEFLVNLAHGNSFLKCKIALGLAEGTQAKSLEEKTPAIKDTIVMMLSASSEAELRTPEGKVALKKQIRDALNSVLSEKTAVAQADNAQQEQTEQKATPGKTRSPAEQDKAREAAVSGPVLEVYFTAFAMS